MTEPPVVPLITTRDQPPRGGLLQKVCDVLKVRADLERKYGESLLGLGESINPEPGATAAVGAVGRPARRHALPGNSLHGAVEAMIVAWQRCTTGHVLGEIYK